MVSSSQIYPEKWSSSHKPGGLIQEIMLLWEVNHQIIVWLVDIFKYAAYIHTVTDQCTGGELFNRIIQKSQRGDSDAPYFTEE